jgi:16S rRNA (cytosine967-C5)-methyltransferase
VRITNDEIAAEVIRGSGVAKAADTTLRDVLKRHRELPPFDAAEIAHTVFRHYRWFGWLREERNLETKFRKARELEMRFATDPSRFKLAELAQKAVPEWMLAERQCSESWLRSLQTEPRLWVRVRATKDDFSRRFGFQESTLVPGAYIHHGELDLFKTPEFHAGAFEIQDVASQLVGLTCAPKPGETWWDTCAGEGGKTMHLSDLMQNKGLIWASDRAHWRLNNLKRRAARGGVFNYRAAFWDGGPKLPTKTKFDGVLVDAPCSGVGTWQRNPHARWTTTPHDVAELAEVQKQLLQHASGAVKPGGRLIYAVCTLTRSETTDVVSQFNVAQGETFLPEMVKLGVRDLGEIAGVAVGPRELLPEEFGGNGMFVSVWRRRA